MFQKHKAPMRIIFLLGQELYAVSRDEEKQNWIDFETGRPGLEVLRINYDASLS